MQRAPRRPPSSVDGRVVGAIGAGAGRACRGVWGPATATTIANGLCARSSRCASYSRCRRDEPLGDRDGAAALLAVSQSTLFASTKKGARPSWSAAAPPGDRRAGLREVRRRARRGHRQGRGDERLGAAMQVALVNDGPVTIWLDSRQRESIPLPGAWPPPACAALRRAAAQDASAAVALSGSRAFHLAESIMGIRSDDALLIPCPCPSFSVALQSPTARPSCMTLARERAVIAAAMGRGRHLSSSVMPFSGRGRDRPTSFVPISCRRSLRAGGSQRRSACRSARCHRSGRAHSRRRRAGRQAWRRPHRARRPRRTRAARAGAGGRRAGGGEDPAVARGRPAGRRAGARAGAGQSRPGAPAVRPGAGPQGQGVREPVGARRREAQSRRRREPAARGTTAGRDATVRRAAITRGADGAAAGARERSARPRRVSTRRSSARRSTAR